MSNPTGDIVNKIVEANASESAGETDKAIALYQEILELDRGGNYGDVAQQALDNLQQIAAEPLNISVASKSVNRSSLWSRLGIKAKTSIILTGVALASSIGVSAVAYTLANQTIARQTNDAEQAKSYELTKEIALFMRDRYADIEAMSYLPLLADPRLESKIYYPAKTSHLSPIS